MFSPSSFNCQNFLRLSKYPVKIMTTKQFSLVLTILFLSSQIYSTFSHGVPLHIHSKPTSWKFSEEEDMVAFPWRSNTNMRFAMEGPSGEPVFDNPTLVLAAERTYRRDPLNGFKRYSRGWNLTERHYWASVGFTGAPFFAIAAIWFFGFGICMLVISIFHFCFKTEPYSYSRRAYALSLIFLVLFTITAIIGCVVLYYGQGKFHTSTTKTLEFVLTQADNTVRQLRDVSDYLASAKQIGVDQVFLPSNVQSDIDQIETKITSSANIVSEQTIEKSNDMKDLLDSVRLALIVTAAIMLLLTFLGFLFSMFGMQLLVYILVILGWVLVAGTFILCGTFLLLHNAATDSCVAMDQWVQNPTSRSALDDILPCVDNVTALETLTRSKEVTAQLVNIMNEVITNVSNINFAANFVPLYFNQSGPLLPLLCNPFFPDSTDRECTVGEVDLVNATEIWRSYVCEVSPNGICTTEGRLTPTIYDQMTSAMNVSYGLTIYAPFLVELQDCTFVRETFSNVYRDHCPGLRKYSRSIYIGLAMVSTAVMLSIICWVIYERERRYRVYTKELTESFEGEKHS